MATAAVMPTSPSVVIHDVTWADYEAMLKVVGNRPIRIIRGDPMEIRVES